MEKFKIVYGKIEKYLPCVYVLVYTAFVFLWAYSQPYDAAPDEYIRYDIPRFMFQYNRLPTGGEPELINNMWGFSYGFYPCFPSMIAYCFMKLVSIFVKSDFALLVAARMTCVLAIGIYAWYCIKIAQELLPKKWRILFIGLATLLPEIIFLGSYFNYDSVALMSTAMITYYCIQGVKKEWDRKSCLGLAISIAVCALTYYNAYGFILMAIVLFIITSLKNKNTHAVKKMFTNGLFIAVIVLALAGWWFVRSAMLHDGDFLGLRTVKHYSQLYAVDKLKPLNRPTAKNTGESIFHMLFGRLWIPSTYVSYIGIFGYMTVRLKVWMYLIYTIMIGCGLYGGISEKFHKETRKQTSKEQVLHLGLMFTMIPTIGLSIYYSYSTDYQAQGRYIIAITIPLMLFVTKGLAYLVEKRFCTKNQERVVLALPLAMVIIAVWAYIGVFLPSFQ